MEILLSNRLTNIYNIIKNKAMYQKVLLLFDNTISNFEINLIHNQIKELCLFNKANISSVKPEEFYNGYKVVIYLCMGEELINFELNKLDNINIFCPTNNTILPFLINNNQLNLNNCYLLLNNHINDFNFLSSFYFNKFYNYLNNIVNKLENELEFNISENLSCMQVLKELNNFKNFYFVDLEILSKYNLEYNNIILLDLILINAFIEIIQSVNLNSYTYVDVYKYAKEDYPLIDKLYALSENKSFNNSIILNFNSLLTIAINTKQKILTYFNYISADELKTTLSCLKDYCKNSNNLLSYLYLYNIFNI